MNIQEFSVRRGLVLGFTAAEIAILLLFLLLLIMGVLYQTTDESKEETIAELTLEKDEQDLDEIPPYEDLVVHYSGVVKELELSRSKIAEQEIKIGEIESDVELRKQTAELLSTSLEEAAGRNERYRTLIEDQQNENQVLRNQIKELDQEIKNRDRRSNLDQKEIEELLSISDEQGRQLEQLQDFDSQNQETDSSVQELKQKLEHANAVIERLRLKLRSLEEKSRELKIWESDRIAELQQENQQLEVEFTEAQKSIHQLEIQNSSLSKSESKGTNSACWYRINSNPDGSEEERALYLFDIQILDDSILVYYPSKSRNGFAEDANFDKDQLRRIFDDIVGFDQNVIGKPLQFSEFRDVFQGFKVAGQNKSIREGQQCTFNVALWDYTSQTNKEGYQNAKEQVVDQIFSSYRYRDDPWPHG